MLVFVVLSNFKVIRNSVCSKDLNVKRRCEWKRVMLSCVLNTLERMNDVKKSFFLVLNGLVNDDARNRVLVR